MALLEAITVGLVVGQYVYHRLTKEDQKPSTNDRIDVPRQNEGAPVALIFGRVRVRRPTIVWQGGETGAASGTSPTGLSYDIRLLYMLGIPVWEGTTKLCGLFVGDVKASGLPSPVSPNLGGTPHGPVTAADLADTDSQFWSATLEFGNGDETQDLSTSGAASNMNVYGGVSATVIPGFRGQATLYVDLTKFTPDLPSIEPEVSSYPFEQRYTAYIPTAIGDDMNPADVIAAVLCDQLGKLGLDPDDVIDSQSFKKAGETLLAEGLGYSRCWDEYASARDIIHDVLRTIDGVLFQRRDTGRYVLKLIRPDYDPNAVRVISPANCSAIEDLDASGWTDVPSTVRVVFTDRSDDYRDNSAVAGDQAAATIQDGESSELVLRFPGICTSAAAELVAAREIGARAQPLLRCRAIVDRSFLDVYPGDVVRLSWPQMNLSNRYMRVGNVGFGTVDSNAVVLDLIEDHHYVYKKTVSTLPPVAPFPTQSGVGVVE